MNIEIIGAVDGQTHYTEQQIATLLSLPQTELSYGATFMGRPSTCLYAGDTDILKLRTELSFNEKLGRRFLAHTLEREQKLLVHHPHKTWFLLAQDNDKFKIGNICPRLSPLHTLEIETVSKMAFLEKIYRYYFYVASAFNLRLDEGLSNFGVDADQQRIYYIDDDIYSWDNFVSFAHVLGVLIRNNIWIDELQAQAFGGQLHALISQYFTDKHTHTMISHTLQDIYMPDNCRRRVLKIIVAKLQQQKVIRQEVSIEQEQQDCIAILSDIHANLPALQAVMTYLVSHNIRKGLVLGDIVGYGPHPSECIELLRASELTVIKGNHDHAVATGDCSRGMSQNAKWCIDWTIPRLTEQQKQWLNNLPLEIHNADNTTKKWQAVHGAPIDPNYFYAYVYQMTYEQNLAVLAERGMDLCFHGHSHIQGLYYRDKRDLSGFINPDNLFSLDVYKHALICAGAVGQPRNGNIGAQFAVYNQRNNDIQFLQIDYSLDSTINDMQAFDFPEKLWQRLMHAN